MAMAFALRYDLDNKISSRAINVRVRRALARDGDRRRTPSSTSRCSPRCSLNRNWAGWVEMVGRAPGPDA